LRRGAAGITQATEEAGLDTWIWILIAVVAVLVVGFIVLSAARARQRTHLHDTFGPEYDRAVSAGGRRKGERRLVEREQEHARLELRPLTPEARERLTEQWRVAEAQFVDEPAIAAHSAEAVVRHVLDECGYPTDHDLDDRAALVSLDHPKVVERYRHGHSMLKATDGPEGTENLRKAMVDFRAVVDELLEVQPAEVNTP